MKNDCVASVACNEKDAIGVNDQRTTEAAVERSAPTAPVQRVFLFLNQDNALSTEQATLRSLLQK